MKSMRKNAARTEALVTGSRSWGAAGRNRRNSKTEANQAMREKWQGNKLTSSLFPSSTPYCGPLDIDILSYCVLFRSEK